MTYDPQGAAVCHTGAQAHPPRPAWIPFAGVYSARLKGYTATEFLQDEDKMVECLLEVNKMFNPDGQCCIFDLQIEAEALGCDLVWADDGPPAVWRRSPPWRAPAAASG